MYDFWTSASSPYLHAVGWCQDMGRALSPPQDYPDIENFTWEDYMAETGSEPVPAHIFQGRPPARFLPGQKLEAFDRRNPSILRVANVVETSDFRIKIGYDGWPDSYDIYVDDDCADLHPCGWSSHVGHPLEPPPPVQHTQNCSMNQNRSASLNGPKNKAGNCHTSACGCPYAQPSVERHGRANERLSGTDSLVENAHILTTAERPNYDGLRNGTKKVPRRNSTGSSEANKSSSVASQLNSHQRRTNGKPTDVAESVRKFIFNAPLKNGTGNGKFPGGTPMSSSLVMDRLLEAINPDLALINKMQRTVEKSRKPIPKSAPAKTSNDKKSRSDGEEILDAQTCTDGITPHLVASWNVQKVVEFVKSLPGCQQNSQAFADEQIDGAALLLLNQADMLKIMNMKLGPVLKIFSVIQAIKRSA